MLSVHVKSLEYLYLRKLFFHTVDEKKRSEYLLIFYCCVSLLPFFFFFFCREGTQSPLFISILFGFSIGRLMTLDTQSPQENAQESKC